MAQSRLVDLLGPLLTGVAGLGLLLWLGFWQVERLEWKENLIATMEARIAADPVALPASVTSEADNFRPVYVSGRFDHAEERYFLTSEKPQGAGYTVITPFITTDGRRIMVDRGYVPMDRQDPATRADGEVDGVQEITGVLRWPLEKNNFTPDPDTKNRIWFARVVPDLALAMNAEPVLVAATAPAPGGWPRGTTARVTLPNDHLQYAITWFSIAIVWALMTGFWVFKIIRSRD